MGFDFVLGCQDQTPLGFDFGQLVVIAKQDMPKINELTTKSSDNITAINRWGLISDGLISDLTPEIPYRTPEMKAALCFKYQVVRP